MFSEKMAFRVPQLSLYGQEDNVFGEGQAMDEEKARKKECLQSGVTAREVAAIFRSNCSASDVRGSGVTLQVVGIGVMQAGVAVIHLPLLGFVFYGSHPGVVQGGFLRQPDRTVC